MTARDLDLFEYEPDETGEQPELSRIEWAMDAEARIEQLTGASPPDLLDRSELASGDEWERRHGPGADRSLGFYVPATGELVVRDCPESERQRADLHEALHAWSSERAGAVLEPIALNEGLTQHLVRIADPAAGRDIGYEPMPDGGVRIRVPDLAVEEREPGLEILRAPEIYPEAVDVVAQLEEVVGRPTLIDLYGTADHDRIRTAFDDARGVGSWDRFCDAASRDDWTEARAIIWHSR